MLERIGGRTRALLEALLVALVFIGLLGSSTLLVYEKSLETLDEEIKIGLMSVVQSAAQALDGDLHQRFTAETSASDPAYLAQADLLEDMRTASQDIRYAYTNVLADGKIYFVVNISPQNDADGDGMPDPPPALMTPYEEGFAPELLMALTEQKAYVTGEYQDQWGTFISAYAPFYNSAGEFVGTLGMDLELERFFQRLESIEVVFEKASITILFLGLVVGLLVWSLRRSHHDDVVNLQVLRQASAQADTDFRMFLAQFTSLSGRLAEACRKELISKAVYFAQLETVGACCTSEIAASESTCVNFSFQQWDAGLREQIGAALGITYGPVAAVPAEVAGQPALLTEFFTQLLRSLQALAPAGLTLTHACIDERPRAWQMASSIEFASGQVPQNAVAILSGGDLAGQFNRAGALNAEELVLLELLRLRNLLPLFGASVSHQPGSIRITWTLDKSDADAQ